MKADGPGKTLKRHDALRRQLEPLSVHIKALKLDLGGAFIDEADRASNLMRAVVTCFAARRSSLSSTTKPTLRFEFAESDPGVGNRLALLDDEGLENQIQLRNALSESAVSNSRDFSVEMEAEPGKAYVHVRTTPEPNKRH